MLIQLSEAAHDERGGGNYAYGQPGDQTSCEVRIRNAKEEEFTYLLRYPDKEMRRRFANDAIAIAMNDHIGYAQYGKDTLGGRYGIHEVMKVFDRFEDITTDCNCDCSSMTSAYLQHNGIPVSIYMRTATERAELAKFGFVEIPYSLANCRLGDICWRNGHTATIVKAPEGEDEEEEMKYSAVLESSRDYKKWSSGAGVLSRECPYISVSRNALGFEPNVIVVQQEGEILANSQWIRGQAYIYTSNFENNASAGIRVGRINGDFNPDSVEIQIPVRFPSRKYIVKIYS